MSILKSKLIIFWQQLNLIGTNWICKDKDRTDFAYHIFSKSKLFDWSIGRNSREIDVRRESNIIIDQNLDWFRMNLNVKIWFKYVTLIELDLPNILGPSWSIPKKCHWFGSNIPRDTPFDLAVGSVYESGRIR